MARGARLLTRDFVLLSQGQLVSSVGDAVQRVALPFWALAATGSTAWVGTVVAASMLPKILLGPVAGALADRASRRAILVWSDLGAGVTMTLVALAAAQGKLGLWMLLAASVLVGVAGACFDPAIAAALPDLVPPRAVGRANATLSAGYTGASILGSAIGGMAYQAVGATLLFLGNGLSFFYSAASEMFVRFPARRRAGARPRPLDELRAGLSLVWHNAGVRGLLVATGLAHVGNSALLVLLVPHCERHAALGARGFTIAAGFWPVCPVERSPALRSPASVACRAAPGWRCSSGAARYRPRPWAPLAGSIRSRRCLPWARSLAWPWPWKARS